MIDIDDSERMALNEAVKNMQEILRERRGGDHRAPIFEIVGNIKVGDRLSPPMG